MLVYIRMNYLVAQSSCLLEWNVIFASDLISLIFLDSPTANLLDSPAQSACGQEAMNGGCFVSF